MSSPPSSQSAARPDASGAARTSGEDWTTGRLLRWMTGYFESREIDAPRVVAEMLLSHVLGCERMRLYMEVERPASPDELARLRSLVARAAEHEPVQYLTGEAAFFWRSFRVDRSTLIPQPSTETLVEQVLGRFGARTDRDAIEAVDAEAAGADADQPETAPEDEPAQIGPWLADIGTGCGCIAVSLAAQLKQSRVLATDLVAGAIDLARHNAERHRVAERIEFRTGSLLEPLRAYAAEHDRRFDAICSNPPYVPDHELDLMDASVREHVPRSAWHGGDDGLDCLRPLVAEAADLLVPGGWLVLEMAHCHREALHDLATSTSAWTNVRILKDHEEFWRVLVAERRS